MGSFHGRGLCYLSLGLLAHTDDYVSERTGEESRQVRGG